MFQNFESTADPGQAAPRVKALRRALGAAGLDGFLVPRADEHQGEYVPACAERLKWLTGFTGSAGAVLMLRDSAHLFVDGRYTLQARQQTDPDIFAIESLIETPPHAWLAAQAQEGLRLGFDPWLHTIAEAKKLRRALEKAGGTLVPVTPNPIDGLWTDRPAPPTEPVEIHPHELAGELARDKLARLAATLADADIACTVLTDPASIAWAFNIRGRDVPHTPLALSFAILPAEGRPALFIDARKLDTEVEAYLTQLADLRAPGELEAALRERAGGGGRVGLDPALAAERLRMIVEEAGGRHAAFDDPAKLPRATKNATELAGARDAHRRDGAAVTRLLHWLAGAEPDTLDEIAVVEKLEALRRIAGEQSQMPLRDISFDTISGAGPNGAVMHYRVTRRSNRRLGAGELYLVDSGGQYRDGTTDVTRTIAIGVPSAAMRRHYTIVLKGLIAISVLRFPKGTRGMDIDPVARIAHWRAGLDFAHGTGHGVGAYLSVHEGPQRIARTGTQTLLPGMILSNEPGYYREGAYGIRLENLIVVKPAEPVPEGDLPMHGFETLTLAPFERELIDVALLSPQEREWLDAYHARVMREIGPLLDGPGRRWLDERTAPIQDDAARRSADELPHDDQHGGA